MSSLVTFLPIIIIMVGLMWWMQRSQKKQQQKRQEQLNTMSVGDIVITIGGLHGVIDSVNTDLNTVDIDCEGVVLTFEKSAIRTFSKPVSLNGISDETIVGAPIDNPIEESK